MPRTRLVQGYEALVERHAAELYRFAFRLTGRADIAEDLLQETFYEAWRSRRRLARTRNPRAWLFGVLRHRHARFVRESGRRVTVAASGRPDDEPAPGRRDVLERLADQEALQAALDTVDDRFKEPFLLVFLAGFTCADTARMLDIPLGTVLSRIHRARTALRARLAAAGERGAGARVVRPFRKVGGAS